MLLILLRYVQSAVRFFKAVSEGERDFTAIALCGGLNGIVKITALLRRLPSGDAGILQAGF